MSTPTAPPALFDEQLWDSLMKEANKGEFRSGAPGFDTPGFLTLMTPTTSIADQAASLHTACLSWLYKPAEETSSPSVLLTVTAATTLDAITTEYSAQISRWGGTWKDWPRGYPDQNDYEYVEACALREEGNSELQGGGLVMWIQKSVKEGLDVTYLVSMQGGTDGNKGLKGFADALWNVVYEASKAG